MVIDENYNSSNVRMHLKGRNHCQSLCIFFLENVYYLQDLRIEEERTKNMSHDQTNPSAPQTFQQLKNEFQIEQLKAAN